MAASLIYDVIMLLLYGNPGDHPDVSSKLKKNDLSISSATGWKTRATAEFLPQ